MDKNKEINKIVKREITEEKDLNKQADRGVDLDLVLDVAVLPGVPAAPAPKQNQHISTAGTLDDEQRIKVLSPYMLVFRRFIRNMLAIVGVVCIAVMALFSFVGGWLMPYGESQVFTEYVDMSKNYAGITQNTEFRFTEAEGKTLPMSAQAQFVLAVNKKVDTFQSQGRTYSLTNVGEDFYLITELEKIATASGTTKNPIITYSDGYTGSDAFETNFKTAVKDSLTTFDAEGVTYTVAKDKKFFAAYVESDIALGGLQVFDYASADTIESFDFNYQAELAINKGDNTTFTVDGSTFQVEIDDEIAHIYLIDAAQKTEYAVISKWVIQPLYPDIFLTIEFEDAARAAVSEGAASFKYTDASGEKEFSITRDDKQWLVKTDTNTMVIRDFESPSKEHWLGTDGNGMDIITRLMYGGRISLMIGFVVVIIETMLGVILGGLSGYFGKWLDNLLMRIVDIFNCIPSIPLIIIIGAIMDAQRVDPQVRMIYLMLILGFLGWPGIARIVRGQILSLREQEFMVAAEATGISVYRKIFKHLVPNVIPQLIVIATMSLGGTILTESVLSFLGLGVKFPFASWGNIINAVSNVYVMTNYWFVWIPAGFCILVTVLGFNFIGDGLRDAFDPKMKR